MAWLAREHPHLVRRYEAMYAGGAYAPTWYQRRITRQVHEFAAEFGCGPARGFRRAEAAAEAKADGAAVRERGGQRREQPQDGPGDTQLTLL
jgi:hypothetical protein